MLPPYVGDATRSPNMSPYRATLVEIAGMFCASDQRKEILRGLLEHRQRLNAIGFQGFQWLSGSFLEDIETLEGRSPRDVDVVTFFHKPPTITDREAWQAFINDNLPVLDRGQVKAAFKVDVQFIDLDMPPAHVVSGARFWYGLFSHRRNGLWKGLLELPLALSADDNEAALLVAP